MAFQFPNLDQKTRQFMIDELDWDIKNDNLYLGQYLNDDGRAAYPSLLREAITNGNEQTLGEAIGGGNYLVAGAPRRTPSGGQAWARTPRTAHLTLAEGEFNRFYIRGLCQRALAEGIETLEVYRAKLVRNPRMRSQAMIGTHLPVEELLQDLRKNSGVDTALGLPPGPNSGLSARLP